MLLYDPHTQKKWKQGLNQIFVSHDHSLIRDSQEIEATQVLWIECLDSSQNLVLKFKTPVWLYLE